MYIAAFTEISRYFCRSNPATQYSSSLETLFNQKQTQHEPWTTNWHVANEKAQNAEGKKTVREGRRLDKQANNNKSEGLTRKARAGAVQSPRKREGGTERRRKSSRALANFGTVPSRSPVHGLRRGRRREHEMFLVPEPNPMLPGSDHGEQRAHFPFSDVTT